MTLSNLTQDLLIDCYLKYLDLKRQDKIKTFTSYDFHGWVGRTDKVSGKLDGEFHLNGKYYGYYSNIKPINSDEKFWIDGEMVFCITAEYSGFHHHFLLPHLYHEKMELKEGKLFYEGEVIDEVRLNRMNALATDFYSRNFNYVLEQYHDSNNMIYLGRN